MNNKFFFDVAEVNYIKDKWEKLNVHCDKSNVVGVTTNPGIWAKAGIHEFKKMLETLTSLCEVISEIRGDNKGIVYVQPPCSGYSYLEIKKFIAIIKNYSDGTTKIGCKLPPFYEILRHSEELKSTIDINVTGISDCSTANMVATYSPRYLSIIYGRMEEAGINADEQLNYIRQCCLKTEIITGAMRTIDGLRKVCQQGTVPTIGTRIWDKIICDLKPHNFTSLWDEKIEIEERKSSPIVNTSMQKLTVGFFNQMDELGKKLNEGFSECL